MSDELRKLAMSATAGPWHVYDWCPTEVRHPSFGGTGQVCEPHRERDADFIAAANPHAVLALLDERDTWKRVYGEACDFLDASYAANLAIATQLEQMRRERDEARSDRDAMAQALGETRADLAEARTTNARLHRRAQGVDARKPDDEALIRRLRAEVRATAKHAGYVTGYVYRLQMAANFAQHATSIAVRERDEARAKLARVRQVVTADDYDDVRGEAIRIIDEKEGGM